MAEKPNMRGNPNPNPAPSLATRIQSSAKSLAKSTLQPGPDLNTTLSTSNSKSGPSQPNAQTSLASGSLSGPVQPGPRQESFRTSNPTDDDYETYQYEPQLDDEDKGKGKARLDPVRNYETSPQSQSQHQPHSPNRDWNQNQKEDGAAVISLLTAPSAEEDPSTTPETDLDPAPLPLSASEREALDSFLQSNTPRLTTASLVPDIDTFLSQGYNEGLGQGLDQAQGQRLRDEVLVQLPGAGDWVGVQERYHEEVWGFLGPVLEAARKEVEQGLGQDGEGPAVRRLRMILGHMGG